MKTPGDAVVLARADAALGPVAPTARWLARAGDFFELTKPRMNFLVLVTTAVGWYMAAGREAGVYRLIHALIGTALTAAGASVLNQFAERRYDAVMPRTARRPLPAGRVAPAEAAMFGVALAGSGVAWLALLVNPLTAALGLFTVATYILLYTPLKRVTTLCTVVGAVPGAIPPVMGWTAATGSLSAEAMALFAILFFWQMPHFLAIAILYRRDYAMGGFRMLPVVDRSLRLTGRQIVLYCLCLLPVSIWPAVLGMGGRAYFASALLLGAVFLSFGLTCAKSKERVDARRLFIASILYLPLLLGMLMFDRAM